MNQLWLPRRPAFSELWPAPRKFTVVESETADWLQKVTRLATNSSPPFGHYRILGYDRAFVKVLSPGDADQHVKADALAEDAFAEGVTLPAKRWVYGAEDIRVGIYPYIDGRYGEVTEVDAEHLGSALASLHVALRQSEQSEVIRSASNMRLHVLEARRRQVSAGIGTLGPFPDKLQSLMAEEEDAFNLVDDGQIVHGDLNPGNILFDQKNGSPIFIDFETATVSWHPIETDVAMVLQRLALVPSEDFSQAVSYGQALLNAYALHSDIRDGFTSEGLMKAMIWLSVRNLALLAELESQGRTVEKSEWSKFFTLLELSKGSRDVLDLMIRPLSEKMKQTDSIRSSR